MHQVIDDLESKNIIINVDEPEIVETEIEKKKRGRPKGSTSKKKFEYRKRYPKFRNNHFSIIRGNFSLNICHYDD